jgi:hypothetical protein
VSRPTRARRSADQYGFLQDLVRRVAYETLARRDRKSRHLAAAAQLERSFGAAEQEVVEVVAAHYLAAYEAHPDADDALEIKARARELLARAAERAGSLGALGEARRSYEQAAELSDEPVEKALLLEMASVKALGNAESDAAEHALRAALELLTQAGELHAAARVSGRLGNLEVLTGRGEGMRRMEEAFEAVSGDEPDADVADLAARLGRSLALGVSSIAQSHRTSSRSKSPRRCVFRRRSCGRSARRHTSPGRPGGPKRSSRSLGMRFGTRSRTISRSRLRAATRTSRTAASRATGTGKRSRRSARPSLSPVEAESVRPSCSLSVRRRTR